MQPGVLLAAVRLAVGRVRCSRSRQVAYYRDMIFKGTLAFVESHYGPTETEAWCRRREDILRRYGECGAAMKEVHGPQEIEAYKHFGRIVGMGESTFAPLNIN